MTEIAKKPIKITETILRDAHQSLIATRMSTEQMLPIIEKLDNVGSFPGVLGWSYFRCFLTFPERGSVGETS